MSINSTNEYHKITRFSPIKYQTELEGIWWQDYDKMGWTFEVTTTTNTTTNAHSINPCREISLTKIDDKCIFDLILKMKSYFYIEVYYNEKPPRLNYRDSDIDLFVQMYVGKDYSPYINMYYGQSFIAKAKRIMVRPSMNLLDYLYAKKEVMERFIVSGDPRIVWCI